MAKRKGVGVAIQVHQLVENFWETKTIQYNSNDNCYVFCYKNQIETRQASERRGGEVGQVSASSGVDEKLCTPYAACLRPRKCLLNRFILAQNTSSSETCNVSIHFKHTILIEGERVEDTIYYYLCLSLSISLAPCHTGILCNSNANFATTAGTEWRCVQHKQCRATKATTNWERNENTREKYCHTQSAY